MKPPIFPICAASPTVTALLGSNPTRLYPFGEAPRKRQTPYAVWQIIGGAPENHLTDAPDVDRYSVQVDVYATTGSDAVAVAEALRDAIEPHAQITRYGGHETDTDTQHKRISFDVSWYHHR